MSLAANQDEVNVDEENVGLCVSDAESGDNNDSEVIELSSETSDEDDTPPIDHRPDDGTSISLSSDDDDDDEENEPADEQTVKSLEENLSNNLYDYDSHVALVNLLLQKTEIDAIRKAFERFSGAFPLTAELWLKWIKVEVSIATSDEDKMQVIKLFDKAVEDYLDVDLWMEFAQFSMGIGDHDLTRKIFSRGLDIAGLHLTKGYLLWAAKREFELAVLSLIEDKTSTEWSEQRDRVTRVFEQQLCLPLRNMEHTYIEWRLWLEKQSGDSQPDIEEVIEMYNKAKEKLEFYEDFEKKVADSSNESEKLNAYRDYINNVKSLRYMICVYERAVAELCLSAPLWKEYCQNLSDPRDSDLLLKVIGRAIRNCPWDSYLWVIQMRQLEVNKEPPEKVTETFEKSLLNGFRNASDYLDIWLTYLEHFKRLTDPGDEQAVERLRSVFNKACEHMAQLFGLSGDPECLILRFWARLEASFLKDMTAARKLWSDILSQNPAHMPHIWLELVEMERHYGDDKHLRKVYHRAINSLTEWPEVIAQSWMMYERECGTLATMMECQEKCAFVLTKQRFLRAHLEAQPHDWQPKKPRPNAKRGYEKPPKKEGEPGPARKKPKRENNGLPVQAVTIDVDAKEEPDEKRSARIEHDPKKLARTIFVSNLDYAVTEKELLEFLAPVEEVKLVLDSKGSSRGFGYAVFASSELVDETLKRDRERLGGRPVFLSRCDPDKTQRMPQFKYATTTERNKLFVRGLPLAITKEELETMFREHGDLKEVRMVCYRNGHFKGLAYVEYSNEKDAANALLKTDGVTLQNHTISVAISAPPPRKVTTKEGGSEQRAQQLVPPARHSKSRLQMPMVPSSVKTENAEPKPSLSNSDFRKMFLN